MDQGKHQPQQYSVPCSDFVSQSGPTFLNLQTFRWLPPMPKESSGLMKIYRHQPYRTSTAKEEQWVQSGRVFMQNGSQSMRKGPETDFD